MLRALLGVIAAIAAIPAIAADIELACSGTYKVPERDHVPIIFTISVSVGDGLVTVASNDIPNLGFLGIAHAKLLAADATSFAFETTERSLANPSFARLAGVISRTDGAAAFGILDDVAILGGQCRLKAPRF